MTKKIKSSQNSLYFLILLGQCFSVFPIAGISKNNYQKLEFKWTLKRTIYGLIWFITIFLQQILSFRVVINQGHYNLGFFVGLFFVNASQITTILFIKLAKDWQGIMKKWSQVDFCMDNFYGYPSNLDIKLKALTWIIMLSALIEHWLFMFFKLKNTPANNGFWSLIEIYFTKDIFGYFFEYVPYHPLWALYLQMYNTFVTFTWNYLDLFIMIISLTLSARYKQIVERLNLMAKSKVKDRKSWQLIREDYNRLNQLCKLLDKSMSNLILLSFSFNIFMIIVQLFYSLRPAKTEDVIERIYFNFSFGFLIVRTVCVALFGATIHDASKEPAGVLNNLPNDTYNIEIQRFLEQVKADPAALTGRKMFKITRGLILEIAGAIVSYELIMVQYTKNN